MPRVTVAMASYNHDKFVANAIDSVLSQQGCDFEFVIVDDGSSDHTPEEIRKFKDSRIRFIPFEKNQGACIALRKAIEEGTGEYVAILNSDDCFLPGKLQRQTGFLDDHPHIEAVFGYPQIVDEQGVSIGKKSFCKDIFFQSNRTRYQWLNHFFYHHNALCHPSAMIRRRCYKEIGYYDPRFSKLPDFDFWIRLLLKHEIYIIPEELIQFRILSGEANASAPSLEGNNRVLWEWFHILRHYLTFPTIEEYLTVFPEEESHVTVKRNEYVSYYLARLILRNKFDFNSIYALFAYNTLFSILENRELSEKLEAELNFRYADFVKMTTHIFHQPRYTWVDRLRKYGHQPSLAFKKILETLKIACRK